MQKYREWTFSVRCPVSRGETVCVTGSGVALGEWKVAGVAKMRRVDQEGKVEGSKESDDDVWICRVQLPLGQEILYRYCVCMYVEMDDGDGEQKVVVRKWETDLQARRIGCHDLPDASIHSFGLINSCGRPLEQCGWLTSETLVEMKLFERAVHVWKKKHQNKDVYVKVTPVDVSTAVVANRGSFSIDEESENFDLGETRERRRPWPIVSVASLDEDKCVFRSQSQFGIHYREGGFVSFQAQVFDLQTVAFLVDVFVRPPFSDAANSDTAEHIGSCYVLPNHFKSTEGRVETTLLSRRFQPVGQFSAAYIIVYPLKSFECDMSVTYARHWKSNWKGLDVGHRGLGNSYTKAQYCSNIRENTIASLKDAAAHGADMVEFDVQVSKDLVPIIYHDYEIVTSIAKKKGDQKMLVQMPLKNLTLEQLHNLKISHVGELSLGVKSFSDGGGGDDDDPSYFDEHEPFPTLERALAVVDPHVGFNIEIKWDMEMMDGSRESHNAFEMNLFIDVILRTVLEHGETRKIFFSTFNPDICTVIRSKQNKYPVLFLTQGINSKYENYRDPRTWSIPNASRSVEMSEILGINVIAEDLIRDPKQVESVKDRGQVLFSWTDDRSDRETVAYLKKLGVDGIVYDRMDVNNSKEIKESIFLVEKRQEEESKRAVSPYNTSQCSCSSSKSDGEKSPKLAVSSEKPVNDGQTTRRQQPEDGDQILVDDNLAFLESSYSAPTPMETSLTAIVS